MKRDAATNTWHRDTFLGFVSLAVFLYSLYLYFNPADAPDFLVETWAWMIAHPLVSMAIIPAIAAVDFAWSSAKTIIAISETVEGIDKKVDSITKDLAELKSDLDDLSRDISK